MELAQKTSYFLRPQRKGIAMTKTIEIRIKRLRTEQRSGVLEVLENWARREGLTIAGATLHLLQTHPIFREYLRGIKNGKGENNDTDHQD